MSELNGRGNNYPPPGPVPGPGSGPSPMLVAITAAAISGICAIFVANYGSQLSARSNSEANMSTMLREDDKSIAEVKAALLGNENDLHRIEIAISNLQSATATLSAENQALRDTANVLKEQAQEQAKQLQALDLQLRPFRNSGH
jgi:septal ring factor EnvC (AmiA/AmiB activator)